jgi:hypothetical protein
MKRITIFNENSAPSVLFDDDNTQLEEYCANVEKVFLSNKVTTLHCTGGSIVLRPSKTTKIMVEEVVEEQPPIKKQPDFISKTPKPLKVEKKPSTDEDMIVEA